MKAEKHTKTAAVTKLFGKVREEYAFNPDVFNEDEPRIAALKRILDGLSTVDRTIIILYCETQSVRELGKILHVPKSTAGRAVSRIREDIIKQYNRIIENSVKDVLR